MSGNNFDNGIDDLPALPAPERPNIRDFILNIYPCKEAAAAHADLLRDGWVPTKLTWWPIGINVRQRAWALIRSPLTQERLEHEMRKAWPRLNIVIGKHLPPTPTINGEPSTEEA
jgi:hypothetical protein